MNLSPTEYSYLSDSLSANGIDLFKVTLQDLCLRNIIKVEQRWVVVGKRDSRKRARYFFCKSTEYDSYITKKKYEKFILDLFEIYPEFRFYKLRQYIKKKFKKRGLELFKTKYVLNDLSKSKLTFLKYFPNSRAKDLCKEIEKDLDLLKEIVDDPTQSDQVADLVKKLDTKIILLDQETITKLSLVSESVLKIESLKFLDTLNRTFENFDSFFYSSSFGFSGGFSGIGGVSSYGGFGGFSGGSFGGGGAMGSW